MLIAALQHWRVAAWVALLALAAGQTVRLDAARAALAQERSNHEAAALAAKVASTNKTLAVERAHAAAQQRIADDFARDTRHEGCVGQVLLRHRAADDRYEVSHR